MKTQKFNLLNLNQFSVIIMGFDYIHVSSKLSYRLLHPKLVVLLVTRGLNGKVNVMTVAWCMPISMNPPLVALSISCKRFSYKLLIETGEFTICVPSKNMVNIVHFCGTRSGKRVDKVRMLKLELIEGEVVKVPIIKNCIAALECKLYKVVKIKTHDIIIGKVVKAHVKRNLFRNGKYVIGTPLLYHLGGNAYTSLSNELILVS